SFFTRDQKVVDTYFGEIKRYPTSFATKDSENLVAQASSLRFLSCRRDDCNTISGYSKSPTRYLSFIIHHTFTTAAFLRAAADAHARACDGPDPMGGVQSGFHKIVRSAPPQDQTGRGWLRRVPERS